MSEDAMGDSKDMSEAKSGQGMSDGFTGPNPYHSGQSLPMMHLQGGTGPVFVQPVLAHDTNYMNDRPQSSTDMIAWDSTSLAKGPEHGGDTPNRSTDHGGYRTPPTQSPTSA